MPKLKTSVLESQNRVLAANIEACKERFKITDAMLADAVECSLATIRNRRKKPETFSLWELTQIANVFDISLCELLMDDNQSQKLELHEMEAIILENLKKMMRFYGISNIQLAVHAHMCKCTLNERLKAPGQFKLKELQLIARRLKTPLCAFLTEPINLNEKAVACV